MYIYKINNTTYTTMTSAAQLRAIATYRAKNREKLNAYRRQYYQDNKDRLKEYGKEYYHKSKAIVAESVARARAAGDATQSESTEASE